MILYHGSTTKVESPYAKYSKKHGDFGRGFYTTTNEKQSIEWARRKQERTNNEKAIVNVYEFEINENTNSLVFTEPSADWLDFVLECRTNKYEADYDVIIGPVADDNVNQVLGYYESGVYTKEEALQRLKIEKSYTQQCFLKQSVCDELKFVKSIDVTNPPPERLQKGDVECGKEEI